MSDLAALAVDLNYSAPAHPTNVVEDLELTAPTHVIRLKYPPRRNRFTLQYRAGSRPCLFAAAFAFDGDTVRLIDGSALPAGRIDVSYQTA